MKAKKYLITIICILSLFIITGCGKKEALVTKDFNKICEDNDLIITDAKDQFEDVSYVKDASIASSIAGWQIEFFTFEDEEHAKDMFDKNKKDFEESKDGKIVTEKNINVENYSTYSLTTSSNYMYISRVDNTVIYLKVSESNKKDVEKIIKQLKY